jgi:hypothetical protein
VISVTLRQAEAINQLTLAETKLTGLTQAQVKELQQLAAQMQSTATAAATAGKSIPNADFEKWQRTLQGLNVTNPQLRQSLLQMGSGLAAVQAQSSKVQQQFTGMEIAGQAMTASFSIAQAAAGNLQAAIFGLGFTFLFASRSFGDPRFLALLAVLSAVQVGLGKLQEAQQRGENVAEQARAANERFNKTLEEMAGFARLSADDLRALHQRAEELGIPFEDLAQRLIEDEKEIDRVDVAFNQLFGNIASGGEVALDVLNRLGQFRGRDLIPDIGGQDAKDVITGLTFGLVNLSGTTEKSADDIEADMTRMADSFREAGDAAGREVEKIRQEFQTRQRQRIELEVKLKPIEDQGRALDAQYDAMIDARREALERETDAIRTAADEAIEIRRDQLEAETEAIRDNMDAQIDAVRKALDQRLDAIRDASDAELEANAERVKALKDREKELQDQLDKLADRRREMVGQVMQAQEELASLEAIELKFGFDEDIAAQIAIRKARLEAIEKEKKELAEQEKAIDSQVTTVQQLIDAEENRKQQIEQMRDAAIQAARDEAEERQRAIRETAEAQIRAAQQAAEQEIKERQRAADAAIAQANRVADGQIEAIQRRREAEQAVLDQQAEEIRLTQEYRDLLANQVNPKLREQLDFAIQELDIRKQIAAQQGATLVPSQLQAVLQKALSDLADETNPTAIRTIIESIITLIEALTRGDYSSAGGQGSRTQQAPQPSIQRTAEAQRQVIQPAPAPRQAERQLAPPPPVQVRVNLRAEELRRELRPLPTIRAPEPVARVAPPPVVIQRTREVQREVQREPAQRPVRPPRREEPVRVLLRWPDLLPRLPERIVRAEPVRERPQLRQEPPIRLRDLQAVLREREQPRSEDRREALRLQEAMERRQSRLQRFNFERLSPIVIRPEVPQQEVAPRSEPPVVVNFYGDIHTEKQEDLNKVTRAVSRSMGARAVVNVRSNRLRMR